MTRLDCPECDNGETEFIQFGGAESKVTLTSVEKVGDGLLELRVCNECGHGIENVLTLDSQQTKRP